MSQYDSLETLIGKFKRAAIDAWMHEDGWVNGSDPSGVAAPGYTKLVNEIADSGYVNRCYAYVVTLPSKTGIGGGELTKYPLPSTPHGLGELFVAVYNESHQPKFNPAQFDIIRAQIDEIVDPWRQLPDPDSITNLIGACREVEQRLAAGATTTQGVLTGGGEISDALAAISSNLSALSGDVFEVFKRKFLIALGRVIGGIHGMAVLRGGHATGQEGLWRESREIVCDAIEDATGSMSHIANEQEPWNWKHDLRVVGWAANGLSIFTGGATEKVSDAISLVLEISDAEGLGDEPKYKKPKTYAEVIQILKKTLTSLNTDIRREENLINDNLRTNLELIRGSRSSYDLALVPISETSDVDTIIYEEARVRAIYHDSLPYIATELDAVAKVTWDSGGQILVLRDESIGIGMVGPSRNFGDLNDLLYELLKTLADEVALGSKNLELAALDLQEQNNQSAAELLKAAEAVENGSSINPWDQYGPGTVPGADTLSVRPY